MSDIIVPTAQGLLRCLQALCEEAALMGLTETRRALQRAVATCRDEAMPAPLPAILASVDGDFH